MINHGFGAKLSSTTSQTSALVDVNDIAKTATTGFHSMGMGRATICATPAIQNVDLRVAIGVGIIFKRVNAVRLVVGRNHLEAIGVHTDGPVAALYIR